MGNIDLEQAAKKSLQQAHKITLRDLEFQFVNEDKIILPDSYYDDESDTFTYNDLNEYEKMNFFVQDEDQDTQSDFDYILFKYQNEPYYLMVYFLEVYKTAPRYQLVKIANAIYQFLNQQYSLSIDDFKSDLVQTIYILLKYSDLILNLISVIIANNIIKNYSKFDEREFIGKSNPYLNDFFDATNNLVISKQLALAFEYYLSNLDRNQISNQNLSKLLSIIKNDFVRNSLYNLFTNNRLSSLENCVLFIQDASFSDLKIQVVVHVVEFIKRKLKNESK